MTNDLHGGQPDWSRYTDTLEAFWHITRLALLESDDPDRLVELVRLAWDQIVRENS